MQATLSAYKVQASSGTLIKHWMYVLAQLEQLFSCIEVVVSRYLLFVYHLSSLHTCE